MRDKKDQGVHPGRESDEDAILSRRSFLIKTALVGAGLTVAGGAACDDTGPGPADTGPEVCLTTDVEGDTGPGPTDVGDVPSDEPQPCLTADIAEDTYPEACLTPLQDTEDDGPQVCLSAPAPDTVEDV